MTGEAVDEELVDYGPGAIDKLITKRVDFTSLALSESEVQRGDGDLNKDLELPI